MRKRGERKNEGRKIFPGYVYTYSLNVCSAGLISFTDFVSKFITLIFYRKITSFIGLVSTLDLHQQCKFSRNLYLQPPTFSPANPQFARTETVCINCVYWKLFNRHKYKCTNEVKTPEHVIKGSINLHTKTDGLREFVYYYRI